MPRTPLDRAVIARAAIELLDAGGLASVTARSLADRLQVRPSALYYHLPDMRSVQDEVATALLREIYDTVFPAAEWPDLLRSMADRIRAVLRRHRDGARVFAGSRITDDSLLGATEQPLAVLAAAGLEVGQAFWVLQSVLHLTVGFVIEEQHRTQEEPDRYSPGQRLARIDPAVAPLTAAATGAMFASTDEQFAFSVDLVIDGVRARLAP